MLSGGARHEVVVGAALLDPLGNGGVCHVAWLLVAAFVARLRLALGHGHAGDHDAVITTLQVARRRLVAAEVLAQAPAIEDLCTRSMRAIERVGASVGRG